MTMRRLGELAPGEHGLIEAVNDDGSAIYTLYRRADGFPPELTDRPRLHEMLRKATPTVLLRTWKLTGTGIRPLDTGLPAELLAQSGHDYVIPEATQPRRIWGSSPAVPVLIVAGWIEAHLIARERIQEILLARTDGKTVPPFAKIRERVPARLLEGAA